MLHSIDNKTRYYPSLPSKYQKQVMNNNLSGWHLKNIQILDHSLDYG